MINLKDGSQDVPLKERPKEFSIEVQIDGLPFMFEGTVSAANKRAYLSLRLPNIEDEMARMQAAGIPIPEEMKIEGVISFIGGVKSESDRADLYITTIESFANKLTPESKYHNAHAARFLLDNLLTLADIKGWRISHMLTAGRRLSEDEVEARLKLRGFSRVSLSDNIMIRQPQPPDTSQPIVKLLD